MFKSNQSTCSSFTAKLRALWIFIKKINTKQVRQIKTIISVISNIFLIAHVLIISKPKKTVDMAENEKTLHSYHVKDFQFKLIFTLKKYSRVISFTLTTNEQF